MAAVLTGTPVAIVWAAGANPAGQSITIPTDATAVVMCGTLYASGAGNGLLSATLNGVSPSRTEKIDVTAGDASATWACVWDSPATGSQTLDVEFDAAPTEGPTTIVAFVKDCGLASAWDIDLAQAISNAVASVTLTTISGQLVLGYDQKYNAEPATPSGWTSEQSQLNNSEGARLRSISATGTTQVVSTNLPNYSSIAGLAISAAGGGATGSGAITLGALTSAATGTVRVAGTLATTLGTLTASSAGTVSVTGQASPTLGTLTSAATGGVLDTGAASITLGALTVSGTGVLGSTITGSAAITLGVLAASAAGAIAIAGQGAITLNPLTASSAGTARVAGQSSPTLGALASSGAGAVRVAGQAAITFGDLIASGAGIVITGPVGTAAITFGAMTVAAEGTVSGEAAITSRGGDDVPRRRSPHRGHDETRAQLKRSQEQRMLADIRSIYREITEEPELRDRAIEAVAQAQPETRAQLSGVTAPMMRSEIARINRRTDDLEISMRMLSQELFDLQAARELADEVAIMRALSELL